MTVEEKLSASACPNCCLTAFFSGIGFLGQIPESNTGILTSSVNVEDQFVIHVTQVARHLKGVFHEYIS
ncbi:MAG: hypothetical protein CVU59_00895 [Deltaproteobacteria bacterium HGW-Deltaproteobacteria-17]|nr:MAG: hypothetical protein CVU59_00895 [Deltaproteobacteria bacterium HGW-Deltaproteobacteria-17]